MPPLWRCLALVALVALAGCEQPRATEGPTSFQPLATAAVTQAQLEAWIRFRRVYGLRADADYVASLAADGRARRDPYDVPLLPEEVEAIGRANANAQALLPVAQNYADDFTGFAGAWLELPRVVLAFTDHVAERAAEAAALFEDRVIVRDARFKLKDLQHHVGAIQRDAAWFESVGGHLVDVGVDPVKNAVNVHIRYPDAELEAKIRARFGDDGWMFFSYDGTPPWKGPLGALDVKVVDADGRPIEVDCLAGSTDPRVEDERTAYGASGRCAFDDLASVTWGLRIDYDLEGQHHTEFREYEIPADGTVTDTIRVAP